MKQLNSGIILVEGMDRVTEELQFFLFVIRKASQIVIELTSTRHSNSSFYFMPCNQTPFFNWVVNLCYSVYLNGGS